MFVKRFQLWLVWFITRHHKFKPLFCADVVGEDRMEQALFLNDSGFHTAAVTVARTILEARLRRLAICSKHWKEYGTKNLSHISNLLAKHGVLKVKDKRRFDHLYGRMSRIVHGATFTPKECGELLLDAQLTLEKFDKIGQKVL